MSSKPLPKRIRGLAGYVTVHSVHRTEDVGDHNTDATYDGSRRRIEITKDIPARTTRTMLWHEWMHSVLDDTGLQQVLTPQMVEALCDAVGTARMMEELGYE